MEPSCGRRGRLARIALEVRTDVLWKDEPPIGSAVREPPRGCAAAPIRRAKPTLIANRNAVRHRKVARSLARLGRGGAGGWRRSSRSFRGRRRFYFAAIRVTARIAAGIARGVAAAAVATIAAVMPPAVAAAPTIAIATAIATVTATRAAAVTGLCDADAAIRHQRNPDHRKEQNQSQQKRTIHHSTLSERGIWLVHHS